MIWGTPARGLVSGGIAALVVALTCVPDAAAQDAEQRAAAAEAYDRASGFYIQRNWSQAARWFETAHRLAPSAPALVQAARSHERAGNDLRAATLGLRLAALYPDDRAASRTAQRLVEAAQSRFFRVDVSCDGCSVELDGTLLEHPSFFIEPDREVEVIAHFETGDRNETVSGPAGEARELELTAPIATDEPPEDVGTETTTETTSTTTTEAALPPSAGGGISPAVFLVAAGLTAVAGGLTLWSGLDTLSGVDAYEDEARMGDPDRARTMLEEGQDKELRTNLLIGATAGLGAVSIVLLLLTDWSSDTERDPSVGVAASADGIRAVAGGRF